MRAHTSQLAEAATGAIMWLMFRIASRNRMKWACRVDRLSIGAALRAVVEMEDKLNLTDACTRIYTI